MEKGKRYIFVMLISVITVLSSTGCLDSGGKESRVGDNAKLYLQGSKYTRIILEIDYITGYPPSTQAITTLESRIDQYCDKSEGVLSIKDSISGNGDVYSVEDIKDLEKRNRDYFKQGSDTVIYCLYLDGEYSESSSVAGLAYGPSSIAIFKEKIDDIDIPFWGPAVGLTSSDYETSIIVHEFGHLLSLVNIGYESDKTHEDENNEHHCIHESCVMYYSIESIDIYAYVLEQEKVPPSDFCSDCQYDLSKLKNDDY